MATLSVRAIANSCLGKSVPISLKRDIFGVYGDDNPQNRSLCYQLDLIQNKPFVRVAIVTVRPLHEPEKEDENLQRDLDRANEVYQIECGAWIYCVGSIVEKTDDLLGYDGILNQHDCVMGHIYWIFDAHIVSAEEDELFDLGRDMGADIVCYYINGSTGDYAGCAAHPEGRRGFWVQKRAKNDGNPLTFAHELTHVIGNNAHPWQDPDVPDDAKDNLMWTPRDRDKRYDLANVQQSRILSDSDMKSCK